MFLLPQSQSSNVARRRPLAQSLTFAPPAARQAPEEQVLAYREDELCSSGVLAGLCACSLTKSSVPSNAQYCAELSHSQQCWCCSSTLPRQHSVRAPWVWVGLPQLLMRMHIFVCSGAFLMRHLVSIFTITPDVFSVPDNAGRGCNSAAGGVGRGASAAAGQPDRRYGVRAVTAASPGTGDRQR